jgi:hypothetical protein
MLNNHTIVKDIQKRKVLAEAYSIHFLVSSQHFHPLYQLQQQAQICDIHLCRKQKTNKTIKTITMKKFLLFAAFAVITLLTATTAIAGGNSSDKKITVPTGASLATLKHGTLVSDGKTTTVYDKKGNWVYTVERFAANSLPLDVFELIRGTYGNYYIAGMEKIEQPGKDDVILVHMQDENAYKTVRIHHNHVKITETISKQ